MLSAVWYVHDGSITQACLRPLGCIAEFCRAIKVQWPKKMAKILKRSKRASRVLDSMYLKLKGCFRLWRPTGKNPCLNRTNIVEIRSRVSTVQMNDEINAEIVSWSRREMVRGWTGCIIHFRTWDRDHPSAPTHRSSLLLFAILSFVQCWASKWSCVWRADQEQLCILHMYVHNFGKLKHPLGSDR